MRRALIASALALLLPACGGGAPELDGTWEGEAGARVTIAGRKVTMTVAGLKPSEYEQAIERTENGYLLRWTKQDGEVLRVDGRLEGDRLLLSFEGQEFALRRATGQ